MAGAIFLSASVPDPNRSAEFARTADSVAIQAAVSALIYVILGRRPLVWGGHPAITPMIWVVASDMGVEYGQWVRLYQSRYFEDEFPEDNKLFQNVTFCDEVDRDRNKSLLGMREQMFKENNFDAAVFIGGMAGIIEEFNLFKRFQPKAKVVPVVSTGGATLEVGRLLGKVDDDLSNDLDYVALLHRHLDISVRERRYKSPGAQPKAIQRRLWRQPGKSET